MPTCWKCGRTIPSGNECEFMCDPVDAELDDEFDEEDWTSIDWDKVKTFDDLKTVLMAVLDTDQVWKKSPSYQRIKQFCK